MSAGRRRSVVASWRDAVRDSELSSTAKTVAWCLATYLNGEGTAFPSRHTLARGCSLSDRTVDAALVRLEAAGFLDVRRTAGGNPRTGTNTYAVRLPAAKELRGSNTSAAKLTTPSSETDALSSEGASPESAESALTRTDDGRLEDGRTSSVKFDPDAVALAAAKEASKREAA